MLSRIAVRSRLTVPRVSPIAARGYSENTFNKKEKAHEDQYVRQRETAELKKLKAQLEQKKAELAQLEKEHEELAKKAQ
ncbi:hypothetical protein C8Q72DRAFT_884889 [Fomitopsis betulina]|nr:hypothetical protein C8Q72DRAFT_884889 [Fomitopsis betulina]